MPKEVKQNDYLERSALVAAQASNEQAIKAAQDVIFKDLVDSVSFIKATVNNPALDPNLRLKAAKEHLELAGLYVQQVQHSGNVTFEPFRVSREVEE